MIASRLAMVTIVVPEYDEAIAFFVDKLGFTLVEDSPVGDGKRWVVVSPGSGAALLLARAVDARQIAAVGHQTGGRVGFFLQTPNLSESLEQLTKAGVIVEGPVRHEDYGSVIVFCHPFGNRWDLIEPATRKAA